MARRPDPTELLAERHLRSRFTDVIHEPDGNVAPDFLVNQKIAVEVRRLNQNEIVGGKPKGLEESALPLDGRINTLLKSFGPPKSGQSLFVGYSFQRPLEDWKVLEDLIKKQLEHFEEYPFLEFSEFDITDRFQIKIVPSTIPLKGLFCLGGSADNDSGGWILSEFDRNLKLCIEHKSPKINREKYDEWWLLLIDHSGHSLSESDRQEFKSFFNFKHSWERIIIVDPLNPINFFEI